MPTRRHFRASALADPRAGDGPARTPALPPELEARIAALESAAPQTDFDPASWFWMVLLGIVVPVVLLAIGWLA